MSLWTAGFVGLERKKPVWCYSGDELPNFDSWKDVNVQLRDKGAGGKCVLAEVSTENNTKLWMADCQEKNYFVCEVFFKTLSTFQDEFSNAILL